MTSVEPIEVELSEDQCAAAVYFKEIPYDDFGAAGTLRPHKLSRLFEAGRVFSFKSGLAGGPSLVTADYGLFILGLEYSYHPDLWRVRCGQTFPFKINTQVTDVGLSSLTLESRLVNELDRRTLATLRFKSVYVDRATRRPAALPQSVVLRCESALKGTGRERRALQLSAEKPEVPTSACHHDVAVTESDTDHNGHTNQSSYVRYCFDAAHDAVKNGNLSPLAPSVWASPLLKLEAFYAGETDMGDRLCVLLWQQEDGGGGGDNDVIRCAIYKLTPAGERDIMVFHATMAFGKQQSRL